MALDKEVLKRIGQIAENADRMLHQATNNDTLDARAFWAIQADVNYIDREIIRSVKRV